MRRSRTVVNTSREGVGGVVVGLSVGVTQRLVQAGDHRLDIQLRVVGQSCWKNVTSGDVNGLREQIVLEHNEAGVNLTGVADDVLPVVEHLSSASSAAWNVEV